MLIFALAGNIALLLSALGLFSAGLAIALQDIITSFVAWILIKVQSYYLLKDIVTINTTRGVLSGIVTEIGVLRTAMEQIVGGADLDKERLTGQVIYFPNNLVLKDCFVNATRNHPILWHGLDITITFESDYKLAKQVLAKILDTEFGLDNIYKLPKQDNNYRILLNIADSGPNFTIVFPAKAGNYRVVLMNISDKILTEFASQKINLAYPTIRAYGLKS
jgi:small-conductance mechanosensitive channel